MNLKSQASQALQGWSPHQGTMHTLNVSYNGQHLTCELTSLDTVGCSLVRLAVMDDALTGADLPRLQQVSQELVRRVNYLLEPIGPIEHDAEGCTVLMRSLPPQKELGVTSYYELLVRTSGELTLARYEQSAGQPRAAVPFNLTREVLLRLIGDLSEAAQ